MLSARSEVRVRKGTPADAKAVAGVFRTAWEQAYRGLIPHTHLQNLLKRRGPEWWVSVIRHGDSLFILEVSGTVAGYATLGVSRTRSRFQGEIYELYVAPNYQGLGFGEHLFEACRGGLDQKRLKGLIVWALADNSIATDFYWKRGGRPVAQSYERFGQTKLEKIAFAWA